ncbi:hypothetical protein [Pseudonocardia zijingensis]|uniref:Uncharacterized protein n=1 Tax=Pseudonocardia zijingensis TaxID=153376 RepID=A0ABP4AB96_9PSEU
MTTTGCGLPGFRCEACGANRPGLRVHLVRFGALGVACMTLCPPCATSGITPQVAETTAARLVKQHRRHLAAVAERKP